ncbi:MAG: MmcQ/YjbR family DNA-binding protein [Bacteroidota bacterium]
MNIDTLTYRNDVGKIAQKLPAVVAATSYGTPAFKADKKLMARLKEDGKTLVVYSPDRDSWMKKNPLTFFITDHYKDYPMMLIDLVTVKKKDLEILLRTSWKMRASAKMLREMK